MIKKNIISTLKKIVVITIFFFFTISSKGQNQSRADSLIKVLNENTINQNEQVVLLKRISTLVSNPDLRIQYSLELIEIAKKLKDEGAIGFGLRNTGVGYRKKGNLEASLEYLIQSTELFTSTGNNDELAKSYTEIGSTYTLNGDTKNSLLYKSKAIEILRKTENKRVLSINLLNTGFVYYTINNLDTALAYYNEAEPIFEEIGLEIGKAYTIGNRALVFWKQGDFKMAKKDLLVAIDMLEPLGDQYGMADYYNQLGNICLEQNQNKEAIKYTAIGLDMAKAEDLKEQVRDASLLLSKLYKEKKDYEKSLNYQTQYIAYKDSIQDQETTQRLADLRTDFEVGQKQAEVDLLSVEKKNQQLVSVGLGIFLLLLGVFAFIIFRSYREKNRINKLLESQAQLLKNQKMELEVLNSTKDKLFSIISHDLRGPMAAFSGVGFMIKSALKSDNKSFLEVVATEVDKSSKQLSNLLENLLNWSMQQQGGLTVNYESIVSKEMFAELKETFESQSNLKNIEIDIEGIKEHQIKADKNMTYTIFRNLISNALKFTPEKGKIIISSQDENDHVGITIKDTGVGMSKEKVDALFQFDSNKSTYGTVGEKGLGLGLQLVYEFVETNSGSIRVESKEGKGTAFIVKLPLYAR